MKNTTQTTKQTKFYYKIGEVAKMFDVKVSLIRFYENEFDVLNPHRNKKGNRLFTQADIDIFHKIFYYIKEKGYTLDGAKQELKKENAKQQPTNENIVETLLHLKRFLVDLNKQLP